MKIIKNRWAYVSSDPEPQQPRKETLTFIAGDSEGVDPADPRLVDVDGQNCLLVAVSNAFYGMPELPRSTVSTKRLNPTTKLVETIEVPDAPILNAAYYASSFWNPLSLPLKPELTEIDEDTYWDMLSAFHINQAV